MRRKVLFAILTLCIISSYQNAYCENMPQYAGYNIINAQNYYKNGQFSSAIKSYTSALQENHRNNTAQIGLINSYISRAEYYNNVEKSPNKAISDLKSVIFYFNYYIDDKNMVNSPAYQSALSNLNALLNDTKADYSGEGHIKTARTLRMKGEFAAAGYDYGMALEDAKYAKEANEGLGDILKTLNNTEKALVYYKNALQIEPNNPELKLKIAMAYENTQNYSDAIIHYNSALATSDEKDEILYRLEKIYRDKINKNPADADAHCNLAVIYQKRGNYDEALNEYLKSMKINPASITTKENLALLYFEQEKYNLANEIYNDILAMQPKNIMARLQKARCLEKLNSQQQAVDLYVEVLKLEPDNNSAQYALLNIYKKSQDFNYAKNKLSEIEGIIPNFDAFNSLAYDYYSKKDYKNAINAYMYLTEIKPDDKTSYMNLVKLYEAEADNNSALKYAKIARDKFPNDVEIAEIYKSVENNLSYSFYEKAAQLYEKGDLQGAIDVYSNINPPTLESYLGLAVIYQTMNNYDKAIENYKQALALSPSDVELLNYLANAYIYKDDYKSAEVYIQKAFAIDKDNAKTKELSNYIKNVNNEKVLKEAVAQYEVKNYDNALNLLSEIIKSGSTDYTAYYYRAMVYDALSKPEEAINDYKKVISLNPSVPLIYYSIAVDYDSIKNSEQAKEYFQKFLFSNKDSNEYTKYAEERLKQLKE